MPRAYDPSKWAYPIMADYCNRNGIHAMDIRRVSGMNLTLFWNVIWGKKPMSIETALDIHDELFPALPMECLFYREEVGLPVERGWLSIKDVAAKLNVSYSEAWSIILKEIPHIKVGKRVIRVKPDELKKYEKRHEVNKYVNYY